jgi:hypothetical protein
MREDLGSDRAVRRNRVATVLLAIGFYLFSLSLAWHAYGPTIGFLTCTPILGVYLAWLVVHRAESWLFIPKWLALRHIHGQRHFFDDRPLRIEICDGHGRIAAEDVLGVLGQKPSAQLLRRIRLELGEQALVQGADGTWWFDEVAVLQWLKGRTAQPQRTARRLHRWLEHEAFAALHRKDERGA